MRVHVDNTESTILFRCPLTNQDSSDFFTQTILSRWTLLSCPRTTWDFFASGLLSFVSWIMTRSTISFCSRGELNGGLVHVNNGRLETSPNQRVTVDAHDLQQSA